MCVCVKRRMAACVGVLCVLKGCVYSVVCVKGLRIEGLCVYAGRLCVCIGVMYALKGCACRSVGGRYVQECCVCWWMLYA